ncbi:MAG: hypothetical protein V8R46_03650 [Eubacterium ramulus]
MYDNQFMILTHGGKIIDDTAEPGYFEVKNDMEPSLFNGDFSSAMEATFERIKYGGQSPTEQKVYLFEPAGDERHQIRYKKSNQFIPITFIMQSCFYGHMEPIPSVSVNCLKFYAEVIPRNMAQVEVSDVNEQFLDEFLEGTAVSYQSDVCGRHKNFLCDIQRTGGPQIHVQYFG